MPEIARTSIYGKLDSLLYKSLESATAFCKLRRNPDVRLEHWLFQLLEMQGSDLQLLMTHFAIPVPAVRAELAAALDRLPADSDRIRDFDQFVDTAVERGWVYASLMFRSGAIRSAHLLVGMLKTASLRRALEAASPTLARIDADRLIERLDEATAGSIEQTMSAHDGTSFGLAQEVHVRDLFVSYRRAESEHLTGRIFDHLELAFGAHRVFKDVDAIPVGARDFAEEIRSQLRSSRVIVAVIGPGWLTMRDDAGRRRLDDKEDFVRIEVRWALDHGVPIVPVLFDGAQMPSAAELPPALRPLSRCQAMQMRVDPDFRHDMKRLIEVCRRHLDAAPSRRADDGTTGG